MDSLNKHVEQISFQQCVTFCEHRKLKGWQPHFQPTEAKSLVWQSYRSTISIRYIETNLARDNSVAKPSASLHETVFFLQLQGRHGHDTTILQGWWSVPLSGSSSFWYE